MLVYYKPSVGHFTYSMSNSLKKKYIQYIKKKKIRKLKQRIITDYKNYTLAKSEVSDMHIEETGLGK